MSTYATISIAPLGIATFPNATARGMAGGWTRYIGRIGDAMLRVYLNERSAGVFEGACWVSNPLQGVNVIDWTRITVSAGTAPVALQPRPDTHGTTIGSGATQCIPTRRGFVFRFVINGPLSLLDAPWCSIPANVVNFGPLRSKQPTLDRTAYLGFAATDVTTIRQALAAGAMWKPSMPGLDEEAGLMHMALGTWSPLGPATPGNMGGDNPGGSDIRFLTGYDQTVQGALLERQRMDQAIERAVHAWGATTGDYLTVEHYGDPSPQYSGYRTSGQIDAELPGYVVPGAGHSGCAYRSALEGFEQYHAAHLERIINPATVAYEYLSDPVAADLLVDLAEEMRLQFSDHGPVQTGAGWQPKNLKNYLAIAQLNPGHGGDCGRYRGLPMWAVVMADKVKPRREYKRYGKQWALWADTCQMANGLWQFTNDPAFQLPAGKFGAQMFEQIYFSLARVAAGKMIGEVQAGSVILRAMDAMFVNRQLPRQPDPWHVPPAPIQYGAPHFLHVGDANGPFPMITSGNGSEPAPAGIGDPTNADCGIALAWQVSGGAQKYERALLLYGWPAATLQEKLAAYNTQLDRNWTAQAMQATQAHFAGVP